MPNLLSDCLAVTTVCYHRFIAPLICMAPVVVSEYPYVLLEENPSTEHVGTSE